MTRGLICFLMLCVMGPVIGQEPVFVQHDIGDCHTGSPVNVIFQDRQCMIWLGSDMGLSRYDGTNCHPVFIDEQPADISVRAMFEDSRSRIWIGTTSGRIFVMDKKRTLKEFETEEGHPDVPITSIRQDDHGQIWFATYGEGLYVYTGDRLFNIDVMDGLSGNDVYGMDSTPDGSIWIGTDNGISVCSFHDEKKHIRNIGLKDGLPDQIVTSLVADDKGDVWVGTFEFGVVSFNHETSEFEQPFTCKGMDEITALTLFDRDELWIGTRTSGVWRYCPGHQQAERIHALRQEKQTRVNALRTDVEGNIWVSMEGGKVMSGFRPFESVQLDIPVIQAIYSDASDKVWVGTMNGLFLLEEPLFAPARAKRILPDVSLNITNMIEDDFGHLWIGTLDKGLYVFDPQSGKVHHIGSGVGGGGLTIMSMALSEKFIWVATLEGVVAYPREINILVHGVSHFTLLDDPWQSNLHFVFQVFVDSRNRVWFASDGNGVFKMEEGQVEHITGDSVLVLKTVYSICEDKRGHIWFNAADFGMVDYDGKTFTPFGIQEGLPMPNLAGINTLGSGDILITSEKGLTLLNPELRHPMYYGEEIGIRGWDPGLNANASTTKGHVLVCGKNVVYKGYSPKDKLSIHPRTQLTAVTVFDKEVDYLSQDRFGHNQNYFSFHYVGLWYTSPASVSYLYKLEGYDRQWKESKDNEASYSNLPPGDYTFAVKASENNSFLDEPIATYSFSIARPFWLTPWFISIFFLTALGGFYWLVKSRERKSARQAMARKDMIESQLTALKAQINPHFLFNSFNTLITIIDENPMKPELAVKYVEKLSDFYRSILQYREHETISLDEEWDLVRNYVYLLQERYGDNLRLHMDPPEKDSFILPLTLQMLVENAVKHNVITDQYPLDLYIKIDDEGYITVTNSLKPKVIPDPSTQFGLNTISSRYQLISDKKVIIQRNADTFVVRIPILKK